MALRIHKGEIGLISFFLCLFITIGLWGQNSRFNFKHLSSRDGLSSNEVRAVLEDSNGFMWFATSDGLNRWDGYQFNIFKNYNNDKNSLPINFLLCLAEDKSKNIWIGTNHGGLVKYNTIEEKFSRYSIIPGNDTSLPGLVVRCIHVDQDNNIWIGTHAGLAKYDSINNAFRQYTFPEEKYGAAPDIRAIFQMNNSELIIQSDQGFFKLKRLGETIQKIEFNAPKLDKELFRNNNPVCFDSKGYLWIGSKKGLIKLNLHTGESVKYQPDNSLKKSINSNYYSVIFEDSHQNIWVGTENRGVNLYNHETDGFTSFTAGSVNRNSISNNIVSNIYEDKQGNVWFSTLEGGVSFFNYNNNQFEYYVHDPMDATSISNTKIGAFFEDSKGSLWVGTEDGGLNRFISTEGKFEHFQLNTNYIAPSILTIEQGPVNSLLISGQRIGLYNFNIKNGNFSNLISPSQLERLQPLHHITDVSHDSNGYIWIITHCKEGIIVYDLKTKNFYNAQSPGFFRKDILSIQYAVSMIEDSRKRIWIAGYLGLYMFDGAFHEFLSKTDDTKSLSSNYLYTLYEDSHDNLWIGSSKGLDRVVENKGTISFERYSDKYFLPTNVKGILGDSEDNLWISSSQGITKFNPSTKQKREFRINNELENQELAERVCYKTINGDMYFGGTNGFIRFNPERLDELPLPTNVHIVDFQIFNTSQKVEKGSVLKNSIIYSDKIELNYKQSVFSFEYAALDYRKHGTVEYAYILEGFDENWNFVGEKRFATYTNLSPGEYTFRVRTTNGNQLSTSGEASLKIIIHPPLWMTYWAYLLYFVLLIVILYLFRQSIINRERLKNELEMDKKEMMSISETNMMKLRFFTNISHEFRTPLTLIKAPIEKLIHSKEPLKHEDQLYIFNIIQSNTNKLLRMVNQLLDYRKLEAGSLILEPSDGDIVDFCRKTWTIFHLMAEQKRIKYIFQTSIDSQIMTFDADKMDKILTNLLSNAFKYTHEGGEIQLSVDRIQEVINSEIDSTQYIRISVKDTGIGIPENEVNQVFDRFYTVTRKGFEKFEGTGIGLTLVKELTELHKGEISVTSIEHEGSEFVVKIPIIQYEKVLKESIEEKKTDLEKVVFSGEDIDRIIDGKPLSSKDNSGKRKILIVEDDNELRYFLRNELTEDFEVLMANNGNQGLGIAFLHNPALIISDIMMPQMDGMEFCKRIKTDERTSHIPVVLLTSLHSHEKQIEGLGLGADDYIFKPFNMAILKSRIMNLLNVRFALSQKFNTGTSLKFENESVNHNDRMLIQSIIDIVLENITNEKINADFISKKILISRSVIYIKIEALTGQTVNEFIRNIRLKKATAFLVQKDFNVTEVAYSVGFSSQSYFTRCFTKKFGKSPKEYAMDYHK